MNGQKLLKQRLSLFMVRPAGKVGKRGQDGTGVTDKPSCSTLCINHLLCMISCMAPKMYKSLPKAIPPKAPGVSACHHLEAVAPECSATGRELPSIGGNPRLSTFISLENVFREGRGWFEVNF